MSPGSPDDSGAKGPRRIDWSRLPGTGNGSDEPLPRPGRPPRRDATPPEGTPGRASTPSGGIPKPGATPAGGLPKRGVPSAGGAPGRGATPSGGLPKRSPTPPERMPRVGDGRTGSQPQVTGSYNRVTGTHEQVAPRRPKKRRTGKDGEPESRLSQPHKRHYLSLWVELPLLLVVAFSAAVLLRTFAVQPFYIPSGSMEQTLQVGDKVLVLKLTASMRSPQRGEVIVFRGTDEWDPEYRPKGGDTFLSEFGTAVLDLIGLAEPNEKDFIKRVIAIGGDTVSCCDADGNVQVNGISLHESEYVYDNSPLDAPPGNCHSRRFEPVTIPEGHMWVMGDHRGNSQDSRCQGPVPIENVIGRAIAVVWPTDRARELEIPSSFDVLEGSGGRNAGEGDTADTMASSWQDLAPPAIVSVSGSQTTARRIYGSQASPRGRMFGSRTSPSGPVHPRGLAHGSRDSPRGRPVYGISLRRDGRPGGRSATA